MAAIKKWNGTAWETTYPETTAGNIIASGTPSSTTFLRGDGTWATPAGGGSGDVVGPASSVDNRIATFDGTTGKLIQDSGTLISGLAASTHSHNTLLSDGAWASSPATIASGDRLVIVDASATPGKINHATLTFGTGTTTFLANNGTWQTPASDSSYSRTTLGSNVSTTSTAFSSTGMTFTIMPNKYYKVDFFGGVFSTVTTTGFGLSVTTSSIDGTPTVRGMFNLSGTTVLTGSSSHLQGSFSSMGLDALTSGNGILATNNTNSSTVPSFAHFTAIMFGGTGSVNKVMTIQFRTEVSGSSVTLAAGSSVVVTEL